MMLALFEQLSLFRQPAAPPSDQPKQRHLLLGAQVVAYTLRQGRRRRLTMTIDERGLSVGAPLRISLTEVENFIRLHAAWVCCRPPWSSSGSRPGKRPDAQPTL